MDMTVEYYRATKVSTKKTHVVDGDLPEMYVAEDGDIEQRTKALCGSTVTGPFSRFLCVEKHRGLDICDACVRIRRLKQDNE